MKAQKYKKRVFYLDFIRAIATVVIILTHFNALFLFSQPSMPEKVILTGKIFNLYIGDIGASLFLIISSASLMKAYDEKLLYTKYIGKRFMAIYPMFWIAYIFAFLFDFFRNGTINRGIPVYKLIFSFLGIDGLLSYITPTFYLVGEWFLGMIILFYIIFPVLRWGLRKSEKVTIVFVLFASYLGMRLGDYILIPKAIILLVRLPELLFGMIFVERVKIVKMWVAIPCFLVLILNSVLTPNIDPSIQTTYIGITLFVIFAFLAPKIQHRFEKSVSWICQYSYPIFLVHHYIIVRVASRFNLYLLNMVEVYCLFIVCLFLIIFFASLLQIINNRVFMKTR